LTPAEVEKRTSSFNARRALLKSNPSLYISKTRLSVRHIPTFVTERILKRLALHSIKTFNAEVKQGKRDPLDVDELEERVVPVPSARVEGDSSQKRKKFKGKESAVRQTKIVRQAERVDPISGKGKSKGYGFIEFHKHSDALRFLRWTNNNPEATALCSGGWWKEELESLLKTEKEIDKMAQDGMSGDGMRMKRLREEIQKADAVDSVSKKKSKGTLVVEFSIENAQVVQRRNTKQQESKPGVRVPYVSMVRF
jgi:nucleolar protein 4